MKDKNKLNIKKISFIENIVTGGICGTIICLGQFLSFKIIEVQVVNEIGERNMPGEIAINIIIGVLIAIVIYILTCLIFGDKYIEKITNDIINLLDK